MITGSCMCGSVKYKYQGEVGTITVCHCSDCRKAQGTASVIAVPVDTREFAWTGGQSMITEFESSPGKKRAFCRQCGSPLYSRRDDLPDVLRLRMGSIDTPGVLEPVAHIFAANLPQWARLDDNWPRYEALEPSSR